MIVDFETAAALLKSGEIVAIPTETVYGLAADAFHLQAVKKTFHTKGRPSDNPLIVHISSLSQLPLVSTLNGEERKRVEALASNFWPGPLTLVMPKSPQLPDIVTGGLQTVAVRMPDHELTLQLIEATGPLTAPSANRSGGPSPTKAGHVEQDFNGKIPVLDGGACKIGLESTVLDVTDTPYAVLRKGAVGATEITNTIGIETRYKPDHASRRSPGTRYTHYKPKARVQWLNNERSDLDNESELQRIDSEGKQPGPNPDHNLRELDREDGFSVETLLVMHTVEHLISSQNVIHYHGDFDALARDLYDIFRTADYKNMSRIYIEAMPAGSQDPLHLALQDRIDRASGV